MTTDSFVNGTGHRLGPHEPPYIACGKCGTEHHYDVAHGEYQGRCHECSGYLRRPTEVEHELFTEFLVWNSLHLDAEVDLDG